MCNVCVSNSVFHRLFDFWNDSFILFCMNELNKLQKGEIQVHK